MSKSIVCTVTNDISQDARMHRICGTLVENGYQVKLVGRLKSTSIPLDAYAFDTQRLIVNPERGFMFYLTFNLKLLVHLMKSDAELICSVDADTLLAGRFASWLSNKELVYDAHEFFEELPELSGKPIRKFIWKTINRVGLWGRVRCYTVNDELANIFTKKYGKSFLSIQNMPVSNTNKRSGALPQETIKLVYVGIINTGRGIEEAIDFVSKHDMYELHIVGSGDLYDSLKERSVNQSRIIWYGFLKQDDIKNKLSGFDIGLNLLSAKSKNYYYSSANKFFDYVHAGLPVLTMNFPVYKRLCAEYKVGELLSFLDETSIQNGLGKLESAYEAYHTQCLQASRIWNWENEKKKLLSFYTEKIKALPDI